MLVDSRDYVIAVKHFNTKSTKCGAYHLLCIVGDCVVADYPYLTNGNVLLSMFDGSINDLAFLNLPFDIWQVGLSDLSALYDYADMTLSLGRWVFLREDEIGPKLASPVRVSHIRNTRQVLE